ncbi:ATP-dependent RNA helicase [Brevibacterium litoralis]|uniref:ATP-dependent RNA helicase n=1 Tax=Brevibacterium litoralis TaxID=3138935 RepID=UPI0032EC2F0F
MPADPHDAPTDPAGVSDLSSDTRLSGRTAFPFDTEAIGAGLVFGRSAARLWEVLVESPAATAVVQAPPGTGKTTVVPPLVANALAQDALAQEAVAQDGQGSDAPGRGRHGSLPRVLVTGPRRVAVRAAASRLRALAPDMAERVAHTVRGESTLRDDSLVEFLTPGVLVRRLLHDPELTGVGAVVLDEVHERSLDTDLLLGILGEVRQLRDDLRLVAMSATVDAPLFARTLGASGSEGTDGSDATPDAAPLIDSEDALFPVEVDWKPFSGPRTDEAGVSRDFLRHVAGHAVEARARAQELFGGDARVGGGPLAGGGTGADGDAESPVDALVFVPGAREVDAVVAEIRRLDPDVEVLPLHGSLDKADQDRAVQGRAVRGRAVGGNAERGEAARGRADTSAEDPTPRIIVSTALAESSLTVPGVRVVLDSGLAREPRRDALRGMNGLVTVSASRASCEQRAGRAGRLGPGLVVRCFPERTFAAAPPYITPEARTGDLTEALLALACWGSPRGEGLSLPEPLPPAAVEAGEATLRALDAVDADGRATPRGHTLVDVPVAPHVARALLDGATRVGAGPVARVVATLALDLRAPGGDLGGLLRSLERGDHPDAKRWNREVKRLSSIARRHLAGDDRTDGEGGRNGQASRTGEGASAAGGAEDALATVVALAHPGRLARRVSGRVFELASGTRAGLPEDSDLLRALPGGAAGTGGNRGTGGHTSSGGAADVWIAIADVQRTGGNAAAGTGAVIRAAVPIEATLAHELAGSLLREDVQVTFVDGRVRARVEKRLGRVVLSSTPTRPDPATARPAVVRALLAHTEGDEDGVVGEDSVRGEDGVGNEGRVRGEGRAGSCGLDLLPWSREARAVRSRLAFCHRALGDPWPDVTDAGLRAALESWLAPEIDALAGGTAHSSNTRSSTTRSSTTLASLDIAGALRRLFPWPEATAWDELVPERLEVPSGSRVRITWPDLDAGGVLDDQARPVVEVKLQECFGWAETPRLVGGRVPVLFHLLSPAGRPLAVTDDLESFWSGPYAQVRAEMRGRYPKHPWPEDPWTAPATKKTNRALRKG